MESYRIHKLEERYVSTALEKLVWSSKMDLVAVANEKGEVMLRRLTWQKVWVFERFEGLEGYVVTYMSWRPDGKALAIAFGKEQSDEGKIVLVDVEDFEVLHITDITEKAVTLSWVEEVNNEEEWSYQNVLEVLKDKPESAFRPKLPRLSKSYGAVSKRLDEDIEDQQKIQELTKSTLLLAGTGNGHVHFLMYGVYLVAQCEVSQFLSHACYEQCYALSILMTEDLRRVSIVGAVLKADETSNVALLVIDTSVFADFSKELQVLAKKYGQVRSIVTYITHTLDAVKEAWESILTEMDTKLSSYAETIGSDGSVAADFLELLMFGVASPELEKFLAHDLTEKGLKKLGHVIEVSYTNVQKLILKHMENAGQALICHLTDLLGLTRQSQYKQLELSECDVNAAIRTVGAFICKALEVQQVIDTSAKNFKAFYRWLYIAVLRLNNEHIPSELTKITQQDLVFTSEFIKSFDSITTGSVITRKKFHLERVGQYLKDEDLIIPIPLEECPWTKFLEENPVLYTHPLIFTPERKRSLIQLFNKLEESVMNIFVKPRNVVTKSLKKQHKFECFNVSDTKDLKVSQIHHAKEEKLYIVGLTQPPPSKMFHAMEITLDDNYTTKGMCFSFANIQTKYPNAEDGVNMVMDLQIYNKEVLSVLLGSVQQYQSRNSLFIQFPWMAAKDKFEILDHVYNIDRYPVIMADNYIDSRHIQQLDSFPANCFAVSGERKVAAVVFHNRTLVRMFETEADEEDEYDDDEMDSTVVSNKANKSSSSAVEKMESVDEDNSNESYSNEEADFEK